MAKKTNREATVSFYSDGEQHFGTIYKQIAVDEKTLRFIHLDRKGNTWVLMDASKSTGSPAESFEIKFIEPDENTRNRHLTIVDAQHEIRAYTVIHIPGQQFYHLDELPDGSWRITHSDEFLSADHRDLTRINVAIRGE